MVAILVGQVNIFLAAYVIIMLVAKLACAQTFAFTPDCQQILGAAQSLLYTSNETTALYIHQLQAQRYI